MNLANATVVFPVIFLGELPDKTMTALVARATRGWRGWRSGLSADIPQTRSTLT